MVENYFLWKLMSPRRLTRIIACRNHSPFIQRSWKEGHVSLYSNNSFWRRQVDGYIKGCIWSAWQNSRYLEPSLYFAGRIILWYSEKKNATRVISAPAPHCSYCKFHSCWNFSSWVHSVSPVFAFAFSLRLELLD